MAGTFPQGSTTGAKAQNAEWFASDLEPFARSIRATKFRVTIVEDTGVVIECTLDSGSNWFTINSGNALTADSMFSFDILLRVTDTFNIRTPTAGGTTVVVCRVDEVVAEG